MTAWTKKPNNLTNPTITDTEIKCRWVFSKAGDQALTAEDFKPSDVIDVVSMPTEAGWACQNFQMARDPSSATLDVVFTNKSGADQQNVQSFVEAMQKSLADAVAKSAVNVVLFENVRFKMVSLVTETGIFDLSGSAQTSAVASGVVAGSVATSATTAAPSSGLRRMADSVRQANSGETASA